MSKAKQIVEALSNEDAVTAQKLINEALLEKLGNAIENKLVDFAPTVFNEATDKKKFAALAPPKDKITFADKIAGAKMSEKNKEKTNEDVEVDEELTEITEAFESELASLVEEIQKEIGEELTEEEIAELANDLLDALSEEADEEDDDNEDEDDAEEPKAKMEMGKEGGTDPNY